MIRAALLLCLIPLLCACPGPPPPELAPVDITQPMILDLSAHVAGPDGTAACTRLADGSYQSATEVMRGEEEGFYWSQGGGCIERPLREIWGVTHNQPHMIWEQIDDATFETLTPPEGFSHAYSIVYIKKAFITVDWTMIWTHALVRGTPEAPEQVVVNYRRIEGTSYLPYWEGTILLEALDTGVTSVTIRNQINASRTDEDDAAGTITNLLARLAEGEPNLTALDSP